MFVLLSIANFPFLWLSWVQFLDEWYAFSNLICDHLFLLFSIQIPCISQVGHSQFSFHQAFEILRSQFVLCKCQVSSSVFCSLFTIFSFQDHQSYSCPISKKKLMKIIDHSKLNFEEVNFRFHDSFMLLLICMN